MKPRGLLLLSGGIDSAVAAHLLQRQGAKLEAIHFSLEPFTDDAPRRKSERLAQALGIEALHVCEAGPLFSEIAKRGNRRYYFVLAKIFMLRAAEAYAEARGLGFLATGENLGQVSSQTLTNLSTIAAQTRVPVLRPLLGLDKSEIVAIAREIGTFDLSTGPEVCDVLGPKHPAVEPPRGLVEADARRIDLDELVSRAASAIVALRTAQA